MWLLTDLATGQQIHVDHALWDAELADAQYVVRELPVPFEQISTYYVALALRRILQASVETGNPVRWC